MPELVAEARFCQQCKFFARRGTALLCLHPNRSELDLVLGMRKGVNPYEERAPNGMCGLEGLNWSKP
jgi:hypothetical protein